MLNRQWFVLTDERGQRLTINKKSVYVYFPSDRQSRLAARLVRRTIRREYMQGTLFFKENYPLAPLWIAVRCIPLLLASTLLFLIAIAVYKDPDSVISIIESLPKQAWPAAIVTAACIIGLVLFGLFVSINMLPSLRSCARSIKIEGRTLHATYRSRPPATPSLDELISIQTTTKNATLRFSDNLSVRLPVDHPHRLHSRTLIYILKCRLNPASTRTQLTLKQAERIAVISVIVTSVTVIAYAPLGSHIPFNISMLIPTIGLGVPALLCLPALLNHLKK